MRRRAEASPLATHEAPPAAIDSLQRGLEAMRCFRPGEDALSDAEIARRLVLPRRTTRRLLDTLALHGFVLQAPRTDTFRLHVACFVVGQAVLNGAPLVRQAAPILQVLANRFDVHALLAVPDRSDMLVLSHQVGAAAAGFKLGAGARVPTAETALGRAWLWTQPAAVQGQWLAELRAAAQGQAGNTHAADLYQAFHDIEEGGACFSFGGWRRDAGLVATPIVLDDGRAAAIACLRRTAGTGHHRFERECTAALVEAAAAIRAEARHAQAHAEGLRSMR